MTSTDHAGFLLAIAADPGEEMHRLAYLDWLTERDDPRAEFIRVQEELATINKPCTLGGWCPVCQLTRRSAELLTTHERQWRGGMACGTCEGSGKSCDICEGSGQVEHPSGGVNHCPNSYDDDGYHVDGKCAEWCKSCHGTGHACWPLVQDESIGATQIQPGGPVTYPRTFNIAVTFRRGFVHTVRAPLDMLLAPGVAEVIGRYHPVERVETSDRHPDESFWWWRDGDDTFVHNRAYLPNDVFNKINHPHILGMNGVHRETLGEAFDTLSAALLPRFRPQTTQGEKTC